MARYTGQQIKAAAIAAGFSANPTGPGQPSPADIIAAVALGESGGNSDANLHTSAENSWGVYQINLNAHGSWCTEQCARDLACSSKAAYRISNNGTSFTPWTIYKNGSYKQYLSTVMATSGATVTDPTLPPTLEPIGGQNPTQTAISTPTSGEVRDAGIAFGLGTLGVLLIVAGIWGFTQWVGK